MKRTEYGFSISDHYRLPPFISDGLSRQNSWEASRDCSGSEWSTDEAVCGGEEKMLTECKWTGWIVEEGGKYVANFRDTGDNWVVKLSTLRQAMLWLTANMVKYGYWAHSPMYKGLSADQWIMNIEEREYRTRVGVKL